MPESLIQKILFAGIPVVRAIGIILCPVPIVLGILRYGFKYILLITLPIAFMAFVLSFVLKLPSMLTLLSVGTFGLLLGGLIREGFLPGKIVLIGGIVLLLILGFEIIFFQRLGYSPFRTISSLITYLKEYFSALEAQEKISLKDIEQMKDYCDSAILRLSLLIPAMLILGAFIYTYLSYEVTRVILGSMGYQLIRPLPISILRIPDILVWGFILGWMAMLVGEWQEIKNLYVIGLNIRCTFEALYILVGLGIATFFLNKYNLPIMVKLLAYFVLILGLKIVMFVGIFDTWFNFRRLKPIKTPNET